MEYLGQEIPKLGFGLMRLPKQGEQIDIDQVKLMVDRFLAAGFTYFDTAWAYPGSEDAIRQALVERYPRDRYQLATKNAAWINTKTRDDALHQFETSLQATGAGYIDYYLLHNLGEGRTHFFDDYDMWDFVQQKKKEGLIKHAGFSFHSTAEELEEILSAHPEMEFVQLQINYGDWENPAVQSRACYEVVRRHGKPIIVMEPVKGGMLANPPKPVADLFRQHNPEASCASWAIRFAASLEGIITVLSGMSTMEQMEDNISFMENLTPLSEGEMGVIREAQKVLAGFPLIPCTVCNYCAKVCPRTIGISGTFTAMNMATLYNDLPGARHQASWLVEGHGCANATECSGCGACEQACPQHIAIRQELARAAAVLGAGGV